MTGTKQKGKKIGFKDGFFFLLGNRAKQTQNKLNACRAPKKKKKISKQKKKIWRHISKCPNSGSTHDDTANCTSSSNCVNCEGGHPSSSLSFHHYIRWKTNGSAAGHEAIQPDPNVQSFSEAAKKSLGDNHPDHEVEILRWKIESLQTEMAMVRAEIATIQSWHPAPRRKGLSAGRVSK